MISELFSNFALESSIVEIVTSDFIAYFFNSLSIDSELALLLFASFLISCAIIANPFPASPTLAASMLAFKASKFVWSEILVINSVTFHISPVISPDSLTLSAEFIKSR